MADEARIRESTILMIALGNPGHLAQVESDLDAMTCSNEVTARIRDALINALVAGADPAGHIRTETGLDPVKALGPVARARAAPMCRPGSDAEDFARLIREAIVLHETALGHAAEMSDARLDLRDAEDESWSARVENANRAKRDAPMSGLRSLAAGDRDGAMNARGDIQRLIDEAAWDARRRKR